MARDNISKNALAKACSGLGMTLDKTRKTLPNGQRMFLLHRGNDTMGFPTLAALKHWLTYGLEKEKSSIHELIHKNPK
jgi:hypothetical protein